MNNGTVNSSKFNQFNRSKKKQEERHPYICLISFTPTTFLFLNLLEDKKTSLVLGGGYFRLRKEIKKKK